MEPGAIVDGLPVGLFGAAHVVAAGGGRVDTRTWLFLPDGRVSRVYPYGGAFEEWRCSGDTCGTVRFDAGRMLVTWDDGTASEHPFELVGDGIGVDGHVFHPARPMTVAALAGRWAEPGGNVYLFGADGTFTFGSLGGSFELEGLALVVTYADGDVRRRTLFAIGGDGAGAPGLISVESEVFARG